MDTLAFVVAMVCIITFVGVIVWVVCDYLYNPDIAHMHLSDWYQNKQNED